MTIGARIRKFRNDGGLTQKELADEVGVTESARRNYERDIRTPNNQQIEKIAEALDVSADSIREIGVSGARGALEVLFRYEKELGLMPVIARRRRVRGAQSLEGGLAEDRASPQGVEAHERQACQRGDR